MARLHLTAVDQFGVVSKLLPVLASTATRLNQVTRQHAYRGMLGWLCSTIRALLNIWEDYLGCDEFEDTLQLHTENCQTFSSNLLVAFLEIEGEQVSLTLRGAGSVRQITPLYE